jgi:hypothetical protein
MYKDYLVKNNALQSLLKSKWITRVESDGTIPKNRLVEKDASTGKIEVAGALSNRVIGANQGQARADGDFFDCEIGPVYLTAATPLVAGQKVKAGASGKAVAFIDATLKDVEIVSFDGAGFTNQPDTDGVTVVSSSAEDDSQTVTIYGIDAGGAFETEELELNGTTDVDSTTVDWDVIVAVELDAATVGDIEVSETSGGLEIVTISAGDLSAGIEEIEDGYAYNTKPTVVADGASTGKVVFYHEATEGATETAVIVTTNGTAEVAFDVDSFLISKALTGNIADTVNLDIDITGTEDSYQYSVGRVLVGADAGDDAIVNLFY